MAADPTIADAAATASRAPLALEELLLRAQAPAPFTVADLEALPVNDGYRYELVDGTLIVSPSPGLAHQRVVTSLVDPQQPSISVLELSPDGYVEVARATGA
jgi:hypothetical protein